MINKLLLIFTLFVVSFAAYSQPRLVQLEENTIIKDFLKTKPVNYLKFFKSTSDTLTLPFFDDFAKPNIYPDVSLWTDNYAYINTSMAINPPSIGVATLDAIGSDGSLYSTANINSFSADTLTSKPIYLKLPSPEDTTVYFSFMYQPCGNGDTPELRDSLILQFYSPIDSLWKTVWKAEGTANHDFKKVIIHINDTNYLQNGFRFRFRNFASITNVTNLPGRRGNVDFWHLDWIYLNKFRNANDTIWSDVSMLKTTKSILSKYESVPWKHYIANQSIGNTGNIAIQFKNHSNENLNITVKYQVEKKGTSSPVYNFNAGSIPDVLPFSTKNNNHSLLSNPFIVDGNDSAEFYIKSYLINDQISLTEPYRWNDTVKFTQKFYNYYSYDDGTAENGFGIDGQQTSDAMLAIRYSNYIPDTLRGIQMYFNHAFENANEVYFYLTIWDDNNGYPGNILFQKEGYKVNFTSDLNKFYTFKLDTTIVLSGTYYIGWKQVSETYMNVGFDIDRDASANTYWNVYGYWAQLGFPGSIMMRPVFGKTLPLSTNNISIKDSKINVWPNPASDYITINSEIDLNNSQVKIYNTTGAEIVGFTKDSNTIRFENTPSGIYFLKIISGGNYYSSRFIINQ